MTEKEYRAHPAISRSELWKIKKSPEKFKFYKENPPEPTPALVFGQLFHAMALEQGTEDFAVAPNIDRHTKEGKAAYAEWLNVSEGKTVVTADMWDKAVEMCAALQENEFCRKLLSGKKEVPLFWTDEDTQESCKCRTDVLTEIEGIPLVVDLKTTSDASTDGFIRDAVKFGYDFQAAMYLEGVKANTGVEHGFVFIAIEKEPPYSINILQADTLFIKHGYDLFREYIGIYHDCKNTNNWYGYLGRFDAINALSLPPWLKKEIE